MPGKKRSRFAAIALLAAAVILLQIAVTRVLSVLLWYHWAFFSISLAMLGVGAPGVWFSLSPPRPQLLGRLLLAGSVAIPVGCIAMVKLSRYFTGSALIFCLACLLPGLLCLGGGVCLLLLEARGPAIGKMYGFDLLGATAGALLVIPLMATLPTPQLVGAIGLLPLSAYALVGGRQVVTAVIAAALLTLIGWGEPFAVRHSKTYRETGPRHTPIYERWTPTARITIFDNIFFPTQSPGFSWGPGTRPSPLPAPRQYWLEQDGSAGTPITEFAGDTRRLLYLFHDVTTAAYQLRPPSRVAIVGAGGGRDILTALSAGARSIDAIELNAAIVDALRGPFAELSGRIYDRPEVNTLIGEGRSVLSRVDRTYDLIQISLTDSWAATAAGAYSLSENYLYTLEAYRLYYSRLAPRGIVSTSRWMETGFGLEVPRLLFLVRAALQAEGVDKPDQHIALLQGGAVGTVLMMRSPLTPSELDRLLAMAHQRGFLVHLPVSNLPPDLEWIPNVMRAGPELYRRWGLTMGPPTDDRPFFFQVLSPLRPIREHVARQNGVNAEGVKALQQLMLLMAGLTLLLFFAPFPLARRLRPGRGFWRGSLFFGCIGIAFMLVEMAWVQRFILYLAHPSLAVTVALGGILLGAGLGSMASARIGLARGQRLVLLLPLLAAGMNAGLSPLFAHTLGWSWGLRAAVAGAVVVPTGLLMGLCFPLGMIRFGDANKAWFWAINGAASVLASVTSLALGMEAGLRSVGFSGAASYLLACVLLWDRRADRRLRTPPASAPS